MHDRSIESVHIRFGRWGGFYLDEYLRIAVEGSAIADVDHMPMLPDSIHFNQLDSAVVVPIAIPVRSPEVRELIIHLITSNGAKVMTNNLIVAPEIMLGSRNVKPPARERVSVFPNPADNKLHVELPAGMEGEAEVEVLDMAGRVVARQSLMAVPSATLDVSSLPVWPVYAQDHGAEANEFRPVHCEALSLSSERRRNTLWSTAAFQARLVG